MLAAKYMDLSRAGDEEATQLIRILTPLVKFRACRDAISAARASMETRGGNGYIEEWVNARLVRDAEEYYREMYRADVSSWNLRDLHMAETVQALSEHLVGVDRPAKIVVWEHNSHVGDARSTGMARRGEHNVGQLLRQQYGADLLRPDVLRHTDVDVGKRFYISLGVAAGESGCAACRLA